MDTNSKIAVLAFSFLLLITASCAAPAQSGSMPAPLRSPIEENVIQGKVVSIADGDTLTLLTAEKRQIKIRLSPESTLQNPRRPSAENQSKTIPI